MSSLAAVGLGFVWRVWPVKLSRIGLAVLLAALGSLAFATSPSAISPSPYQVPTWWSKAQWLLNASTTPPCQVQTTDFSQTPNIDMSNELTPQSETSIAINPSNPSQIVGGSNEIFCLPMDAFASASGGAAGSWKESQPPLPPAISTNGTDFGSDPGVAWDTNGNVYYSYIVVFFNRTFHAIQGSEMAVARSSDLGATWNATFFNLNVGSGKFNDKPMIAVDTNPGPGQNTIYVAWDNASPRNGKSSDNDVILVSHSTDGGVSFSAPVQASPSQGGQAAVIGADPFVGPNHTLYVAWQDAANPAIRVASSTNGGQSFGATDQIATTNAVFQVLPPAQAVRGALIYPACAAAPTGNRLYCSWSDATASDGMRVFVSHSDDAGVTWSAAARVSEPGVLSDQFNQWLAVDPTTGHLVLSWNDSRNDPDRLKTDIFFAESTDLGVTFTTSQVTNAPTDETVSGANLGNQYGDYEGISAFGGVAQPIWTDRRARTNAPSNLDEEIFTDTVRI
jgi:hypothetical protein